MAKTKSIGWALLPILVTAAILAILPSIWFGDSPYTTSLAVQALVFAAYGVGFNLIFGSTNQLFLCVGALAAVGGYGAGILANETSLPTTVPSPCRGRQARSPPGRVTAVPEPGCLRSRRLPRPRWRRRLR